MKRQATGCEKIFANHISDKGQVYNEFSNLKSKKINSPISENGQKAYRHFTKEDTQTADEHMKRCSISIATREMKLKP